MVNRFLLLLTDEFSSGGVHIHNQLGIVATIPANHVPDQVIASAVPVKQIENRGVCTLLENLVPAMFLRRFECLVRIHL